MPTLSTFIKRGVKGIYSQQQTRIYTISHCHLIFLGQMRLELPAMHWIPWKKEAEISDR
jgi:hypothetical protein